MGMTALELYHALGDLLKQDQSHRVGSYEVVTEGCDCDGDVGRIELRPNTIYLHRGRTDEQAKLDEQNRKRSEEAYNRYLEERIRPEFRDLLP